MAHTQEGETFPEKLLSSKLERESECVFVSGKTLVRDLLQIRALGMGYNIMKHTFFFV